MAITAAERLRRQVLDIEGTVLFCYAGYPDKVIRFQYTPECLREFKVSDGKHIFLDMGKGPCEEAWKVAQREVFLKARRDRPIPEPMPVAENSKDEWSLAPEDVPVVENAGDAIISVTTPPDLVDVIKTTTIEKGEFVCEFCGKKFSSERALKIHMGVAHKEAK